MINKVGFDERSQFIIKLILIVFWGCQLLGGDSYYVVYAVLLIIAFLCTFNNRTSGNESWRSNNGKYTNITDISMQHLVRFRW